MLNIAVNLVLIPRFGMYDAAASTAVTYVFILGILIWDNRSLGAMAFARVLEGIRGRPRSRWGD